MSSGNVTVCIRLRPFMRRERAPAVVQVSGNTVRIQVDVDQLYGAPEAEQRQFVFDRCLGQDTGQDVLYEQVGQPILASTLEGFNGTLFAYGQTGSGKSFSIMGPENNPGIIPRLTAQLFEIYDQDEREEPASEMRISLSFLEIYNEELKDLLDPRPRQKKLYVHQHPKLGVYVPHLTEAAATSAVECARLMDFGAKIRATAQTNMNSTSSRSHSVLTLRITQVFSSGKIRNSSVNLCDLAGSERVKKSGAQGQRMREGSCINNSLSVLGQVISKLAAGAEKKGVHLPFRQSKLTHLLMDALSGNSVTTMLANVSPAHSEAEESLSTLRFAESVKKVKTKPQLGELAPEEPALLLESFRAEIDQLQQALVKEVTCLPRSSQLSRAIEASESLMQSFAQRSGAQWAQAVAQTRALEDVQRQLLEGLSLPMREVERLAGVNGRTPYLLNISDDPALSGCLLYFLRPAPGVTVVGQAGPQGAASAGVQLRGLGIPARLCELIWQPEDGSVSVRKVCGEDQRGRLLVNGRPVGTGVVTPLKHSDRLVFGWAFCFRLVISGAQEGQGGADFDNVSNEMLEYTKSSTMGDLGVMRAAGHWQAELGRLNVGGQCAEQVLASVGELLLRVEEANVLCGEVREAVPDMVPVELDVGLCFGFRPHTNPPDPVVRVRRRTDGCLIAVWPAGDFERRLLGLRDAHRDVLQRQLNARWAWRLSSDEWWAGQASAGEDSADSAAASEAEDNGAVEASSSAVTISP